MFEPVEGQGYVPARPEEVLDIYNSINSTVVAPPGQTPEGAQAYILSVYQGGLYHVYIFLHLLSSNGGLVYRWDEGGVPGNRLNKVYEEAFNFTVSMGFMIDNMHYREKSPAEKAEIHAQVPAFHEDLSRFKAEEEKVEELQLEEVEESEVQVEPVEEEEEAEIDLSVLKEEEESGEAVQEISFEEQGEGAVELGGGVVLGELTGEEDQALSALEAAPSPAEEAVEEDLLNALEQKEEGAPSEKTSWEAVPLPPASGPEEETQEGMTVPSPVMEEAPIPLEPSLTPEEEEALGGLSETAIAAPTEGASREEEIPFAAAEAEMEEITVTPAADFESVAEPAATPPSFAPPLAAPAPPSPLAASPLREETVLPRPPAMAAPPLPPSREAIPSSASVSGSSAPSFPGPAAGSSFSAGIPLEPPSDLRPEEMETLIRFLAMM